MHFSVSTVNFCIFLIFNQFKHLKSSKKYKTHATNSKIHGACYAIVKTDQVKNSSRNIYLCHLQKAQLHKIFD